MMSYAICVLLLGLGLGMVLAKCPTPNEVDSYDSRFQWGAHVNGGNDLINYSLYFCNIFCTMHNVYAYKITLVQCKSA